MRKEALERGCESENSSSRKFERNQRLGE